MDSWLAANRIADKLAPETSLKEGVSRRPGYKNYAVLLKGNPIGHVEQADETMERGPKGARYVTHRWTRKRWRYSHMELRNRSFYDTRKRAVWELIWHLFNEGKLADE